MELSKEFLTSNEYVLKKTNSVYDPEFTKTLKNLPWSEWFDHPQPLNCKEAYLEKYHQWIHSSQLNAIKGLDSFPHRHLINGTTQSFDEFYHEFNNKRLRLFKGEYAYHRRVFPNWKFIEDGPLEKSDSLIISAPFCSTGKAHDDMSFILNQALELSVPVLIDCAYFGTCHSFEIDLSHPAIKMVSFSLTKGIGLGDIRSGIRYSREDNSLMISQQNLYNHTILAAAKIGLHMMKHFTPDFIPSKYRTMQEELCKQAKITPTNCMHIAMGDSHWDDFKVDDTYNRLGIRELIKARRKGLV